jgi:hypothetical protein
VILIDGLQPPPLGTKADGTKALNSNVTISLQSTAGIDSIEYRLVTPSGATTALGSSTPSRPFTTTLGPFDKAGTYRLTAIANASASQTSQIAITVLSAVAGLRIPGAREQSQWDPVNGWFPDIESLYLFVDGMGYGRTPGYASLVTPPLASTFTANPSNGAGAALVDISGGGLLLSGAKGASDDSKSAGFYRAKSGTKTLTVCLRQALTDTGGVAGANAAVGLYFGESATGRIKTFRSFAGALPTQLFFNSYTNPATAVGGGAVLGVALGSTYWLRLVDDGTNIVGSYSMNGKNWTQACTEARGTFLTTTPGGDRMGLFVFGFSSAVQAEILSYSET